MCSFNIKAMYTNIPKADIIKLKNDKTENNPNTINQKEITDILK
jgi:hypothetical protein